MCVDRQPSEFGRASDAVLAVDFRLIRPLVIDKQDVFLFEELGDLFFALASNLSIRGIVWAVMALDKLHLKYSALIRVVGALNFDVFSIDAYKLIPIQIIVELTTL